MFEKILIANRGEIAIRIMRTCREMGIKTVAIYSDADESALHVRYADEAYRVGEAPSSKSYLLIDKIIEVAIKSKAQAIHPGYGFLSENPLFSQRCKDENIVFIGPSPYAIEVMGDKVKAREAIVNSGVPVIPGTECIEEGQNLEEIASQIGYPLLIKAAAGGGGKGMRKVFNYKEFPSALRAAKSEALSSFGDSRVYIEKYIESPRHVEFQILGDMYGNIIHIFERECSVQRRHQKVIEETPSLAINNEVRMKMGEAAVKAAKAVDYVGAGTIEFIVDKNMNFYFLEMNTRLQVEHPITEMVVGVDLVKAQIEIASNLPLPFKQNELSQRGHAIECRIYAEDPNNNFLPSPGKIKWLRSPAGYGVREDSGVDGLSEISMYYDPLIAKLITWGKDRNEAIRRMERALSEYQIHGIITNIPLHKWVLKNEKFIKGEYDTHLLEDFKPEFLKDEKLDDIKEPILSVVLYNHFEELKKSQIEILTKNSSSPKTSMWKISARMRERYGK